MTVGAGLLAAGLATAAVAPGLAGELAVVNPRSQYPEGPMVVEGALIYAEMGSDQVMRWNGEANRPLWSRPGCGPTSVARAGDDLLVFCHREGKLVRISAAGATLQVIDRDSEGRGFPTPNASVNDATGGVYFSSSGLFAPDAPATGAVLYLSGAGQLARAAEGIDYANGVALTRDGRTLYVSEHLARRVLAYTVAADGSLSDRRAFVALDDLVGQDPGRSWEVGPDGLATDSAGNLYIAEYGAGRLLIVGADARLKATIAVAERYVTAPALSPDEGTIYLTAPVSLFDPGAAGKVYAAANPVRP
ncbi:MAG: SMP-30/gluconolactonase/LRE family protein [Bauldia sp.]